MLLSDDRNLPMPLQKTQIPTISFGHSVGTGLADDRGFRNHKIFNEPKEELMKSRPLHDRVVIERIDAEAKTAGGIIIPDTAQEKPQQGKVTAVGPGGRDEAGKLIPIDVKVGDRILFGKWSGTEVKIDGVEYLIMKESDIMGVLVEAEAKKKAA
jgi:chaperonin GroES